MHATTLLMLVTFLTGHVVCSQSTNNYDDDVGLLDQESNNIVLSRQVRQLRTSVIDEIVQKINHISQQLTDIGHNLTAPDAGLCWHQATPPGWILIQQNYGRSTFFNQRWNDYKNGFGDVSGDFWLGNDRLHQLTSSSVRYKVRFDLQSKNNSQWYWAEYRTFCVRHQSTFYYLIVGGYSGTAGDSFSCHSEFEFETKNINNVEGYATGNYGLSGGWWWAECAKAAINASPLLYPERGPRGFWWGDLPVGREDTTDRQLMTSRMWLVPL